MSGCGSELSVAGEGQHNKYRTLSTQQYNDSPIHGLNVNALHCGVQKHISLVKRLLGVLLELLELLHVLLASLLDLLALLHLRSLYKHGCTGHV